MNSKKKSHHNMFQGLFKKNIKFFNDNRRTNYIKSVLRYQNNTNNETIKLNTLLRNELDVNNEDHKKFYKDEVMFIKNLDIALEKAAQYKLNKTFSVFRGFGSSVNWLIKTLEINKQLIIKSYLSCSYSSKIATESFSNNSSIFEIRIPKNTDINYIVIPSLKKDAKIVEEEILIQRNTLCKLTHTENIIVEGIPITKYICSVHKNNIVPTTISKTASFTTADRLLIKSNDFKALSDIMEIFDINTAEELLDELLNEEKIRSGDISPEIMKKVEENIKKYFLNIKSI